MPFANLPTHEKDAFFALLDEYFTSRPDLLARVGSDGAETQSSIPVIPTAAAITAAQRTLANPAASRAFAAGIQRASSAVSGNASSTTSLPPSIATSRSASSTAVDNDPAPSINFGRVAAAAQAFSSASATPTPPPPRAANPPVHKRADPSSGLVPQKKFGDVDVSSAGAMFRSLRGSTAAKNAPPTPVRAPSAFVAKKAISTMAPPPVRRLSASPAAPVPEPEPEPEPEEEEVGEWAEALYDYTSEDAGDLHLRAGETVLVTERTSSDWWTGEIGNRSGLFPATYARLL